LGPIAFFSSCCGAFFAPAAANEGFEGFLSPLVTDQIFIGSAPSAKDFGGTPTISFHGLLPPFLAPRALDNATFALQFGRGPFPF